MATRLFGVETEYALTALDRRGKAVERQALLHDLLRLARERLVHLPDRASSGVFVASGRFYVDAGDHPEFATAECSHPDEVVRCVRAGDRILAELGQALLEKRDTLADLLVLRNNVDYSGNHATWGSHESYLHGCDPHELPRQIIPHLVSRIVFTGAGGFNAFVTDGVEFTLSPRVWHLEQAVSDHSTQGRGIFHSKDEPLCSGGYHRLHVICGESLCSDLALWLRLGTTAVVVALAEAGVEPGEAVQLRSPLLAMRRFASDPTCRADAATETGGSVTALAIQRHYLTLARRHVGHELMPPWTEQLCDRWEEVLDHLEGAPLSVATELDWATKLALYRARVERNGLTWESFRRGGRAVDGIRAAPAASAPTAGAVDAPEASPGGGRDPAAVARLRGELFEIDTRFGQLGNSGIFAALDRAGAVRERLVSAAEVARALGQAPAGGRAQVRGAAIQRLHGRRGYTCDWTSVWDTQRRRLLDLTDPFTTSARWVRSRYADTLLADLMAPGARTLQARGLGLYRDSRYREALRLFRRALRSAPAPARSNGEGWSHFWTATLLHNMGRLRTAGALLDELVRSNPRDDLLYMAITRRVLIDIERPAALDEIERSLLAAEERIAALGHSDWRSRLLLARARLLEARGAYAEALAVAVEGLERRRAESNGFAMPTHMRSVLLLCLRTDRLADTAAHLETWSTWNPEYPRIAEAVCACGRSELARAEGRIEEAVHWAEQAYRLEEVHADRPIRSLVHDALVRARLCAGDLARARTGLVAMWRLRWGEVGADRYGVQLLWADYQLARAQRTAGVPVVDPARRQRFDSPPAAPGGLAAAARWLCRAERSYRRAHAEGTRLDALLACDVRAREIAGRRALLEETKGEIERQRAAGQMVARAWP